jgi:toxin YoeB
MQVKWTKQAIKEYKSLKNNQRIINKLKTLISSIESNYDNGIGKPERLKWYKERVIYSRRIDEKNRIVYEVFLDDNNFCEKIHILQVIGHY